MQYFVKFGYLGTKFTGFQRGNGDHSVEDTVMKVLSAIGIEDTVKSAARTDRGVSATGNVFTFHSDMNIRKIMAELNNRTEHMIFHSYSPVSEGSNPRHNESKIYRYIVFQEYGKELKDILDLFTGTHDFSAFARVDDRNPIRTIEKIDILPFKDHTAVDFHGRSFIWQQIRRIMGFVLYNLENNLNTDPFSDHGMVKLAPPDQLILRDISYENIEFKPFISPSLLKHTESEDRNASLEHIYMENALSTLHSIYSSNE